ncbi:hypothetical protein MMC31_006404 [Peltigera leucophlebia]|nr:hypothetical protein [Peltigera leucophlebia]
MPVIWKTLNIPLRSKLNLSLVFGLGSLICIVSIVRLRALVDWTIQDGTYANSRAIMWTSLESSLGIICACIVVMRPYFGKLFPNSHVKLSSSNPQKLRGSPALSSSVGGRQSWALNWARWVQKSRLGMNSVPRQAESQEGSGQARRFQGVKEQFYQPKVHVSVTNTTTVEVGSDTGGSTIVNGDLENSPQHPKRGLSPGAIMVKREWCIDSLAV